MCKNLIDWPSAAAQCSANGMRLARVDDMLANDWIVNTLEGSPLPADTGSNWIWLGGTDAATEGTWLWPDGVVFYQNGSGAFAPWGPAEPNNGRGGENCLAVRVNFRWTDLQCTELHYSCCEEY
jgi:hypothetical protein